MDNLRWGPNQEGGDGWRFMNEVLPNKESAPWTLSRLRFRDPDKFVAGGIHNKLVSWQRVLEDHPERELLIRCIRYGIDVEEFGQRFCGTFQGVRYFCDLPMRRVCFAIMVHAKSSRVLLVTPYYNVFPRMRSKCGEESIKGFSKAFPE